MNGYDQIAIIFPIVVAAPRYFAGAMQLGGLMQTVGAFGQVQSSMSWFVDSYASLAQWRAIVERLSTFHRAIVKARAETHGGFVTTLGEPGNVHLHDVTMSLPDGTKLLDHADLMLTPAIRSSSPGGPAPASRRCSACWPASGRSAGARSNSRPNSFFLPQRPYVPLGTLRHVITYPNAVTRFPSRRWLRCCAMSDCRSSATGWTGRQLADAAVGANSNGSPSPRAAGETGLDFPRRGDGQRRSGGRG